MAELLNIILYFVVDLDHFRGSVCLFTLFTIVVDGKVIEEHDFAINNGCKNLTLQLVLNGHELSDLLDRFFAFEDVAHLLLDLLGF